MDEKKLPIDNLIVNYKIAGEGPAILILHGWAGSSDSWIEVQKILEKEGYKVICPDLPGFGKSQKPSQPWGLDDYRDFVEKFISVLNLEKFYLLGHSFGGALSVKYGLKFPQKIEKLFLIDAACFRKTAFRKRLFYLIAKILKIFSFLPFYSQTRKAFYKFIVGRSDYLYTEGVMKDSYLRIIQEDLGSVLEQIQTPTIIIWGEEDKTTRLREARIINDKIKNSKLEIIPNIGHSPNLEAPEELTRVILKYLK